MNEVASNLASRWKRLAGALIDCLIFVLIMVIILNIMSATGVLQRVFRGEEMTVRQHAAFSLIVWVVFLMLNRYQLLKRGQTIGKVAVKTRIVDLSGNIPNFGKVLVLRYLIPALVAQIPMIGSLAGLVDALFIFGKERRCIHDYLAATRVINA